MENIVVIGGGLMGSSVTWKLAERGKKVLLLEQQGEAYSTGSSYGIARISRSLGPKKDVFSYVHNKTVKEVAQLIQFLKEEESTEKHQLEDIYATSPVTYIYHKDQYDSVKKLWYKKQRKDYRVASANSSFRKFGMTLPKDTLVVREFRKHSGTINPTALIKKLRIGVTKKGGQIKYKHKAVDLIKKKDFFEITVLNLVTKETQIIQTKKVVVAAGPYTVSVLKSFAPYFNRLITPKRVVLSFFKIKDERYQQLSDKEKQNILDAHPIFSQLGKEYFAMIDKIGKTGSPIFKGGGHQMRRNINHLDRVWEEQPRKKEQKWIKKQFRKYMEMLEIYLKKKDIEQVDSYNCVYSETRTEVPLVTPIFNQYGSLDKNIIVIGGMSGIGAKGCLGYGSIGADLLLGKKGKTSKIYRKAIQAFSNPSVRLHTRRIKRGRLF